MSLRNIIDDVLAIKDAIAAKDVKAGWAAEIQLQKDAFDMVYAMQASPVAHDPAEQAELKAACFECEAAAAALAVPVGAVGAWGDGKILAFLKEVLPLVLQLIPLFVEPAPAP